MRTDKTWIETWTGRQFWPLEARTDEVFVEDIAWMLAGQNRWKGASRKLINIAQHSVIVSLLCEPEHALQGLLHDATEAYLGDMAGPIKGGLPDFVAAEERLWKVIAQRFGVPVELHESVKRADAISLTTERRDLFVTPLPHGWTRYFPPPSKQTIKPWNPIKSAVAFLTRFNELGGREL